MFQFWFHAFHIFLKNFFFFVFFFFAKIRGKSIGNSMSVERKWMIRKVGMHCTVVYRKLSGVSLNIFSSVNRSGNATGVQGRQRI